MIAIVLPFYQKEEGILSRALDSIAAQIVKDTFTLIIDYGSPLNLEIEVELRPPEERNRIRILQ
jgi:succinoglycan biosynthesis protein ExoW